VSPPFSVSNYSGTLLRIKELQQTTPEDVITAMNPRIGKNERQAFASFLMAIMKLDPNIRPSAAQLLQHEWINR